MANLAINTTQNVNLDYKVVTVGERILAFLIDLFLFFVYLYVVELITTTLGYTFTDDWTILGFRQLLMLPIFFYSLYMHILFNGRTVGKMFLKTKVVKLDGSPVQWSNYLTLWMLRLIDIWMFMGSIGLLFILFSERKQRLGDMAAGTVVISTKNKVKITHTMLEDISEDYQPTFMNVTQLTDKDARLIKEAYLTSLKTSDYKTLTTLRNKIESVLDVSSPLYDKQFIDTILKDYNHFTRNM
ncbi:RDD family protein [Cochleicola gelatinilyticus]|uniref:RDD domain-containing protein n=1 Tax=Cochleicola gelatinilyticus TaxID=1763537 RepID=A0A167G9N7_9FLAO|nr:RDD family protein [Cochleicola gelatinilyticus]OAB77363.1 hypothetical protein ULVI_12750 [Cochleicola gelatinilyticus]